MVFDDLDELRRSTAISHVVGQVVDLRKEGRLLKGCCPFHHDNTPSFYVSDERGRYWCFGCDAKGGVFDFVMEYYKVSLPEAIAIVVADAALGVRPPAPAKAPKDGDSRRQAIAIWNAANEIGDTVAAKYLKQRGLPLATLPSSLPLRFARLRYKGSPQRYPALIYAVQAVDGAITGIQRTYLNEDGGKLDVEKPKLSKGTIKGSAARLGGTGDALIVCEGLEDGLSIWRAMPGTPVWVAAGAGMMAHMQLPEHCSEVTIAADNDNAGMQAAENTAIAFQRQGKRTRIMRPSPEFKDFNEQAQKGTIA